MFSRFGVYTTASSLLPQQERSRDDISCRPTRIHPLVLADHRHLKASLSKHEDKRYENTPLTQERESQSLSFLRTATITEFLSVIPRGRTSAHASRPKMTTFDSCPGANGKRSSWVAEGVYQRRPTQQQWLELTDAPGTKHVSSAVCAAVTCSKGSHPFEPA